MAPCAGCGFEYETVALEEVGPAIVAGAVALGAVIAAGGAAVRARPSPLVWSALEYACHVRDVLLVQRERILLGLRAEAPALVPMGRDERVEHDGYGEQDPRDVARQLDDAALLFTRLFGRLSASELARTVIYNFPAPAERTLAWLGVHTVHEVVHHLADGRAALASGSDPHRAVTGP